MKNQYFGDINDYRKYGVLRILSMSRIKIGICWMLTKDDVNKKDGQITSYNNLIDYDHELHEKLDKVLSGQYPRQVSQVPSLGILPDTLFFSDVLDDNIECRKAYFEKMLSLFSGVDLIFFDPDNGLEVNSTKYGAIDSSKFLYWCEVKEAYEWGHSLLIYQHFPRIEHYNYINKRCEEIRTHINIDQVYVLKTSTVVYFLIPQKAHDDRLRLALEKIEERWTGKDGIEVIQNQRIFE